MPVDQDVLQPNEALFPDQSIRSADGRYTFVYQGDGNLVLYGPFGPLWASNTNGRPAGTCAMQGDGNLVIYGPGGEYIWDTATDNNAGARLVVQNDGNVLIYRPDNSVVWATNTAQPNPATGDTIQPYEALFPDQSIRSADGRYTFVYQGDGNLVLYGPFGPLWASNTDGRPFGICVMQGDGNLVISGPFPGREYVWDTATHNNHGARLVVQNDGNVVIYRPDNSVVWISDTLIYRTGIPNLDGWVEVRLRRDGTVHFRGHVHNGGLEAIAFQVGVVVRGDSLAIGMAYRERVGGLGWPRDHDWEQTFQHDLVRFAFTRFLAASLDIQVEVRGDITGFLGDIARFLVGWVVGSVILTPGLLQVIVLGTAAGSIISTGGFDSGARLVGGTLWLLGPQGMLVALASEGVAALGSQEREINDAEYNFASQEVFGGTLPPRERIVLTDTAGGSGSVFVFPRFDGRTTVNLGQRFYSPLVGSSLLIHELTHVWQLQNTHSDSAFIAAGIGARVCELVGADPYALPQPLPTLIAQWHQWLAGTTPSPPTPVALPNFRDLGLEQQASVTQIWFADTGSLGIQQKITHPLYRYIEENIRTGSA